MSNQKVLLVDSDTKSQRVLEVSLKKAGFEVATARNIEDAQLAALASPPDVVVTEADFPVGSGFDLCRRLRDDARTAGVAVVFLAQDGSPEAKIRAISAGADEYLTKPTFVKEILTRIGGLLDRRAKDALSKKDRPANFRGTLGGMGLVDIFQLIESGRKSGVLHLRSDPTRSGGLVASPTEASIWFRDGRAVDAEVGAMRGETAVYRLLLWDDGDFELDFSAVARDTLIHTSTQGLLLEGMRRVDEWARLAPVVPPLHARLEVDYRALAVALPSMPGEVEQVVRLFDGRRKLLDALDDAPIDELSALSIVARLLEDAVLTNASSSRPSMAASATTLEAWLSQKRPPEAGVEIDASDILANLPSELTAAMIPSMDSASQILAAANIPLTEPPSPAVTPTTPAAATARPEPLDEPPPSSSAILSRSTIPASGGTLPPRASGAAQAAGNDGRLVVRRLSSVVAPAGSSVPAAAPNPPAAPSTPAAAPPKIVVPAPLVASTPAPAPAVPSRPAVVPPASNDLPMMVRPAAAPVPTVADDEEDDDGADAPGAPSSTRPRRNTRGAAFRAVRRPGTSRPSQPIGADILDEVTETGHPSPSAAPKPTVEAPKPAVEAPKPAAEAPKPAAEAPKPAVEAPKPAVTEPTDVTAPPAKVLEKPAAKPTAPMSGPPEPRAAAQVSVPPFAPRAPAPAPAPQQPPRRDLDDDFAYLKQTPDEEPSNGVRVVLLLALVGIVVGFVAWLSSDTKQKRVPSQPAAAVAPAQPKAGWPSEAPGGMTITTTTVVATASTASVAAAPAVPEPPPAPAIDRAAVEAELERGLAALKKDRFRDAQKAYEKAIELDAESAAGHAGLGHALSQLGKYADATNAANKAIELSGDKLGYAHYVLGLVALDNNKLKDAGARFKRFLELDPTSPFASPDVRKLAAP